MVISPEHPVSSIVKILGAFIVAYFTVTTIYNLYFHPLAKIPGPLLWRAHRIGFFRSYTRGRLAIDVPALHEKYGVAVRIAPDEVSFAHENAINEVLGPRANHTCFPKNPVYYKAPGDQPENMITTCNFEDNQRMRKLLMPGFTDRALRAQEPIIQGYIQLLVDKLSEIANTPSRDGTKGSPMDISQWLNFYTFDVIGDLGLGESFNGLTDGKYHKWVYMVLNYAKGMAFLALTRFYWGLEPLLLRLVPASLRRMQQDHYNIALEKIHRRMNLEMERPDLMSPVLKANQNFEHMSRDEFESTFAMLIIAGSETTGTALSGMFNYLVQAPDKLAKLRKEIRDTFSSPEEITLASVKDLPYLNATLNEGLRLCNPVPGGLPRVVSKGGDTVCGYWLPGGTHVSVNPSAMSRSPKFFHDPLSFIPERFLPEPDRPYEFDNDRRASQFPFGFGPRNCTGRPLAWAHMRLVMARLNWHFDFEEVTKADGVGTGERLDWTRLKTYIIIAKLPVWIRILPRGTLEQRGRDVKEKLEV
jgi:cytochrome P450